MSESIQKGTINLFIDLEARRENFREIDTRMSSPPQIPVQPLKNYYAPKTAKL